jgi:hypothetical protein
LRACVRADANICTQRDAVAYCYRHANKHRYTDQHTHDNTYRHTDAHPHYLGGQSVRARPARQRCLTIPMRIQI